MNSKMASFLVGCLLLFQGDGLLCQYKVCDRTITYHSVTSNTLPDEMSICIVDLKFDGKQIKICEFGEGISSQYKGYDALYGDGALWAKIWGFLQGFKKPFWFVEQPTTSFFDHECSISQLRQCGGEHEYSFDALQKNKNFIKAMDGGRSCTGIPGYTGFVVLSNSARRDCFINILHHTVPAVLVLGKATNFFVKNKCRSNELLNDAFASAYKPRGKTYEKKYTPTLADTIIKDLDCEIFVIKPVDASKGRGVIMVERKSLGATLEMILRDTTKIPHSLRSNPSYSHWLYDKKPYFIVEEFAISKTILVNNKPYDPTMRVIFALWNELGTIHMNFFDAYWKLPAASLEEDASLTEKHKSHIVCHGISSAPVDQDDYECVVQELCSILPHVYTKMLDRSKLGAADFLSF